MTVSQGYYYNQPVSVDFGSALAATKKNAVKVKEALPEIGKKILAADEKIYSYTNAGVSAVNIVQRTLQLDEGSVKSITKHFSLFGNLSLISDAGSLITGDAFKNSIFKAGRVVANVAAKSLKHASSLASLVLSTTNPLIGTAINVASVASRVFTGLSAGCGGLDKAYEMLYNKDVRTIGNCIKVLNSACIVYLIAAPLLVTAPPLFGVISVFSSVLSLISFGLSFYEEVSAWYEVKIPTSTEHFTIPVFPEIEYQFEHVQPLNC